MKVTTTSPTHLLLSLPPHNLQVAGNTNLTLHIRTAQTLEDRTQIPPLPPLIYHQVKGLHHHSHQTDLPPQSLKLLHSWQTTKWSQRVMRVTGVSWWMGVAVQ